MITTSPSEKQTQSKPNQSQNKPKTNPIFTKKLLFLAILSAEFCSNARLAASAEAQSYYSTSSIDRSCVTQQLGKMTAQNQKYTIRHTFSLIPAQMIDANPRFWPKIKAASMCVGTNIPGNAPKSANYSPLSPGLVVISLGSLPSSIALILFTLL